MKKMLVIDDSLSVRESLRVIFQSAFQVEVMDSWQEAASLLDFETFDLVIMGLSGRGGQEMDLLREIRTINPSLPLIALVEQEQRELLE